MSKIEKYKMKIYHNNRCRKSREGLAILQDAGQEFEIVNYIDNPPTEKELRAILTKLNFSPIELIRKNEKIWKEEFKGKDLNDEALIKIMIENPKLIERPIVVKDDKAVVGRPPENINRLLHETSGN